MVCLSQMHWVCIRRMRYAETSPPGSSHQWSCCQGWENLEWHELHHQGLSKRHEMCSELLEQANALFHHCENLLTELQRECEHLLRTSLQDLVPPSTIEISDIDPMDPQALLPLDDVHLGEHCKCCIAACIEACKRTEIQNLRVCCQIFFQTAVLKVKKTLPISGPFFHEVKFIAPATALCGGDMELPALPTLQKRYAHLLPHPGRIEHKWRTLLSYFNGYKIATLEKKKSTTSIWAEMELIKACWHTGIQEYLNIGQAHITFTTLSRSDWKDLL